MRAYKLLCATAYLFTSSIGQQMMQTDSAPQFFSDSNTDLSYGSFLNQNVFRTKSGNTVVENHYENIIQKVVDVAPKPSKMDKAQQSLMLDEFTDDILAMRDGRFAFDTQSNQIYDCANRINSTDPTEAFRFLPIYDGLVTQDNPTISWNGICYDNISLSFNQTSVSSFDVTIDLQGKKSTLCKEGILLANTEVNHFELFYRAGQHKITFNMPGKDEQLDVGYGGIKAFSFCEHLKEELESLLRTISLWIDLKPDQQSSSHDNLYGSEMIEKSNVRFVNVTMGWEMEPRPINEVIIDPNTIKSGDYFSACDTNGLSAIIMYGTGAFVSHNVMALWFEDGLYIVESTDPVIVRTPWQEWIDSRTDMISHLPLNAEKAAQFNETAAREFFFETEGVPYGYHNFLYGWIDTPEDNLPPMLPHHFVPILFSYVEMVDKFVADNMFSEALNLRLGVSNKNITELAAISAQQEMSLEDVMAMVELDSFRYTGLGPKDGYSFVCSAYVAAMYKVAGLFGDFEINATEFSPAEVYRLNFFDLSSPRPEACIEADPDLPYCQVKGKFRQVLPYVNSVDPYQHMNEHCSSVAPDFYRAEGC